ncbi:MAG: DUF4168 domain-containing protein [Plectolyngbya sp. WJT66-NPBG17]|jgi:hypothetical protein|nr:DUF4168 domain-containing protein [Plectolyngbya sp. WJT66-NPBG17]MBW4523726.1 DUF4168 domain-containing protein [Phormidium tanganyikae FI6-MK23]
MIQRLLLGGCAVVVAGLVSLPVQAQQAPQAPTSKPAPAAQSVTPAETRQFANAVKQVLVISQESETQATQAIRSEGLTEQRFDEIFRSQRDPQQKPSKPVESTEKQKYDRVLAKLVQLSKDNDAKVETAVKKEGLDIPRFNQIFQVVRANPQLRQQVQQLIQQK